MRFVLFAFLFVACNIDNDQVVEDSFAFIHTNTGVEGSGFYVGDGWVITACHVLKTEGVETKAVYVSSFTTCGKSIQATSWECYGDDLAKIKIPFSIFKDQIDTASLSDGLGTGCFYGRYKGDILKRCSMFDSGGSFMLFKGINAPQGMSGGPCIVEEDGHIYAVGVVHWAYNRKGKESTKSAGWTVCNLLF